MLERFLPPPEAALVRGCFAGLWALDGPDASSVRSMALADPDGYVLKPQREGGGNNLYGAELAAALTAGQGLGAYVLMQRIRPPVNSALFMRGGRVARADALCELGVYSTFLARNGQPLRNEPAGTLLRTKTADSNEGGVAAGFAVLDSPLLTEA